ncbi:uncharacterized protein MONOS_14364 [Monocercomonoides exilis]|uniref:uncharacterized protein n=1 Tax=Monocercomonoides exilis TaxID=2049356 RepID=UPI003559E017|nr:hypothetical protein MONOS_14364 [Monocercomonoides exilis]|eukprot:MONOS_14364.1-p1 / transcript=MONOS_14364.1 / gene=MONOS_14364 / organism=Monocercomonoides_exilis_PA203 / gene_product=unspecified product / transcript_product=unspecified product / location=Mono_scaffold00989:19546-20725(+) / protein_length=302 / sequence_SO=supercontig / SO=protein_coding / is_pseudo=false
MEKNIFEPLYAHVPASILEFAAQLPKEQREKCHSLFSRSAPNLPMPTELDRFSESLDVLEKADFWKAVSQVRAQSTNLVPLPSLPTSDNICAYPAAPPNLEGVNSSVPVADEVRCDPPTNLGAAAPKNKWELSFVAPIIDEEGVPSRQFFSQLMKGEKAVKEPEKEKTPFLRSTDVQREVARKSIENESFQNDKCLDEDQKFVLTEFKRKGFWSDLRESMKPCVEKRDKNWIRKKEWRWLMTKKERKEEEEIDKIEDERKEKEENEKMILEAAIEMERLKIKQAMAGEIEDLSEQKLTTVL